MSLYSEPEPYARMLTGTTRRECFGSCVVDVTATRETGIHSGRRRFRVFCNEHGLIHPATTGPGHNVEMHLRQIDRGEEPLLWPEDEPLP